MKQSLLTGFMLMMLLSMHSLHAGFIFRSTVSNGCEYLPGKWIGGGKASNWLLGDCVYHGYGAASPINNTTGQFTIEVVAHKDSGSSLCPNSTTQTFIGFCSNGVATVKTEYGILEGGVSQNSGTARGILSAGPVDAKVIIQFERIG